jgi:hypothetical protein
LLIKGRCYEIMVGIGLRRPQPQALGCLQN